MMTERLIELVKKYAILYDLSHEEYKNIRKKDKIWDEIGIELNDSGEQAKKKWKNIRDTFVKYIRTTKTRTGQAAKNIKKWQWAEQMEMFRPFLTFAKTSSNVSELVATNKPSTAVGVDDDVDTEEVENKDSQRQLKQSKISKIDEVTYCVSENTNNSLNSVLKADMITESRKRRWKNPESVKSVSSVDAIVNYFENKRKVKQDATDLLFLSYSNTIKSFSGKRQAETKLQIAQIIAQQEKLHYDEQPLLNSGPQPYQMSRPSTSYSHASGSNFYPSSPLTSPISGSEPKILNDSSTDCEQTIHPSKYM